MKKQPRETRQDVAAHYSEDAIRLCLSADVKTTSAKVALADLCLGVVAIASAWASAVGSLVLANEVSASLAAIANADSSVACLREPFVLCWMFPVSLRRHITGGWALLSACERYA